jgi:hypothetical protein
MLQNFHAALANRQEQGMKRPSAEKSGAILSVGAIALIASKAPTTPERGYFQHGSRSAVTPRRSWGMCSV